MPNSHYIFRNIRAAALLTFATIFPNLNYAGDMAKMTTQNIIPDEGLFHQVPDAAYLPDKNTTYKVVFAVTKGMESPSQKSESLSRVARTVNLYAAAGVPLKQLKFVVVISGAATSAVLDEEHYKQLFKVGNPNLDLIRKLRAAGVDVAVCGQAVIGNQFEYSWVSKEVTLALSALTTITILEQKGYALMPL